MATSTGSEIDAILLERYPDLFFLLHYVAEDGSISSSDRDLERDREDLAQLDLNRLSTLYVYGIGNGAYYEMLQSWLETDSHRRLIFLEDQMAALQHFVYEPIAIRLFADPQVIVRYLSHPDQMDQLIQELMIDYPCDRIDVLAQKDYRGDRYEQIRLELFRKSTLSHAAQIESLQYPKLLVNILSNIHAWQSSFLANGLKGKFQDIPAIICGAGPSLKEHLPYFKALEDQVLLIAGGSAITALSHHGITPHLGMAFDPNQEEFDRLKNASAYEMPLIYGTRLESNVLNTLNGEKGYLVSNTGGPCETHFEQALNVPSEAVGLDLGLEALSVTTMALSFAVHMGCNPILLSGVDLAYSGMQRYAPGVLISSEVNEALIDQEIKASERHLKRVDIQGRPVSTLVKWIMESDCIAAFAQKHPQVRFINLSRTGLGFQGIPNLSFAEVMEEISLSSFDLRALVHAEIQQLKLPVVQELVDNQMRLIAASLQRLLQMSLDYRKELERIQNQQLAFSFPTAKLILLELDFEEEPAFQCLNPWVGPILDRLLNRFYPSRWDLTEEERLNLMIQKQIAKFKRWQELIEQQLSLFHRNAS